MGVDQKLMDRASWADVKRILCVRLDTLGDVLMTTPSIRALKYSSPRRHITLMTSASGAAAGRLIPEVDDVLVYDAPWMKAASSHVTGRPGLDLDMVERLRRTSFDAAVIFTVYSQSALPAAMLCYLAGIPRRLAHCRENPYDLLTQWVRETEPDTCLRHEVRRQLDLVATVGAHTKDERLSMAIPDEVNSSVGEMLARVIEDGRPWVVIHAGATAASRRYPPDRFAIVGRRLVQEFGYGVVFTGTEPERELIEWIQTEMGEPSHSLVGALDLPAFAAVLARASLLISNNTGAVHVAAAVGTPVVDLYALTNPQHTPWQVPHRVLFQDVPCKYCYKSVCPEEHQNCLRLVEPDKVLNAAAELLKSPAVSTLTRGVSLVHTGD
ncbi:MAG TPA: glycosyltransferase family 9 protein [Nitrospiraceae bacterium]|nr:glycosyltransferase family 9 protein [Nitrospiraceae bacterium]